MRFMKWVRPLAREGVITVFFAVIALIVYGQLQGVIARLRGSNSVGGSSAPTNRAREGKPIQVGSQIQISGVDFHTSPMSIVMVISGGCHFCIASEPFYRSLLSLADAKKVPVYVAIPDTEEQRKHLESAGLARAHVVRWRDLGFAILGTPTLALVDGSANVQRLWKGKLDPTNEGDVKNIVSSGDTVAWGQTTGPTGSSLSYDDVRRLVRSGPVVVLDTRERDDFAHGHFEGAVNIPRYELPLRAREEIQPTALVAVDCSNLSRSLCDGALGVLAKGGFTAKGVNAGASADTCAWTPPGESSRGTRVE